MTEIVGVVKNINQKKSNSGDSYTIVDIEGEEQGFFDWDGHVQRASVKAGDKVAVKFSEGEYPRIEGLKKLASGNGGKTKGEQSNSKPTWRDVQIARQCALKATACVLQDSKLEYQERAGEIVVLAEKLEKWILR